MGVAAVALKPETASHYRSSLRRFIIPALGDRRIDDITASDVLRLHNSLKTTPCAANLTRCVLSCLFTKAVEWEVTTRRNPTEKVQKFEERAVERFLNPDEREALERVLITAQRTPPGKPGYIGPDGIWAIRLLTLTGMRRDEIRNLRWEYVEWRQRCLRLPDSKTGKRDIIVSDEVMALLGVIGQAKGNPRRGLVVCSRTGNKLHSLGATWRIVRAMANIPDVRLHDLRHSVASDAIKDGTQIHVPFPEYRNASIDIGSLETLALVIRNNGAANNNGVPLEVVGKMLGHKNYRTTQRYAHIADTALRNAVNLTSATIVRAGRGKGNKAPTGPRAPRSRQ